MVLATAVMVIASQLLAIANDVVLRLNDPSDVFGLVVLVLLSLLMLRRASWARWTIAVFVGLGGVLELAGFALLIVTVLAPASWAAIEAAVPALATLGPDLATFEAAPAYPLLASSVLVSALLDLAAAAMLTFAPSVRSYFSLPPAADA